MQMIHLNRERHFRVAWATQISNVSMSRCTESVIILHINESKMVKKKKTNTNNYQYINKKNLITIFTGKNCNQKVAFILKLHSRATAAECGQHSGSVSIYAWKFRKLRGNSFSSIKFTEVKVQTHSSTQLDGHFHVIWFSFGLIAFTSPRY